MEDVLGDSVIPHKPSSSAVSSTSTNATPKRPHSADKTDSYSSSGSPSARKNAKLKRKTIKVETDNLDEDANISTSSQTSRHSSPLSLKLNNNIALQRQYLPPAFSLLAPVHVPITVTSAEIMDLCKLRKTKSEVYQPIFDEQFSPPKPPVVPTNNGKLCKEKVF